MCWTLSTSPVVLGLGSCCLVVLSGSILLPRCFVGCTPLFVLLSAGIANNQHLSKQTLAHEQCYCSVCLLPKDSTSPAGTKDIDLQVEKC